MPATREEVQTTAVLPQGRHQPVLVYGAAGWIGGMVCDYLTELKRPYCVGQARADDASAVSREIAETRPCWVLACLGRTHGVHEGRQYNTIDFLEQKGRLQENLRDNLVAPLTLAATCQRLGYRCVQIATGCVYLAEDLETIGSGRGFGEDATPNFTGSSYSTVKGATDRLLRLYENNTLFFRIRMPVTHDLHKRSFLTKILSYAKICSVRNSISVLDGPGGLLKLFVAMADAGFVGCYNGTNPGVMSHNEVLELYRRRVDIGFSWVNFDVEEQAKILDGGRSNCHLDSTRLEEAAHALQFPLPSLRTAMDSVMEVLRQAPESAL